MRVVLIICAVKHIMQILMTLFKLNQDNQINSRSSYHLKKYKCTYIIIKQFVFKLLLHWKKLIATPQFNYDRIMLLLYILNRLGRGWYWNIHLLIWRTVGGTLATKILESNQFELGFPCHVECDGDSLQ